jgi:hypothetical protein
MVLGVHVVCAAHASEHPPGVIKLTALQEGVRRVREEQGADGDDGRGHRGEREAEPPAPAAKDLVRAVVDEVGSKDAEGDHELEPVVEHAAYPRRRHLGEVHHHALLGEAYTDAEEDATEDEHGHVLRGAVEHAAGEKGNPADEHGPLAASEASDGGGAEEGDTSPTYL